MAIFFISSTLLEWKVHNKAEFNKIFSEVSGNENQMALKIKMVIQEIHCYLWVDSVMGVIL